MNKINNNFQTSYNIFEFEYNRDYLKDMDNAFKSNEMIFNFPENNNMICESFKHEYVHTSGFITETKKDLFEFEQDEFDSMNYFNNESSPFDSLYNMASTQRPQNKNARSTDPSLSLIDQESCKKIDTCDKTSEIDEEFNLEKECLDGDLNSYVAKLLNSTAVDYLKEQGVEVDEKTAQLLTIKKRKRKTKAQVKQLEIEYEMNQDWSKCFMEVLGEKLNMCVSTIYKWHWDQISKIEKPIEINRPKTIRLSSMPKSSSNKRMKTK
jgi:hypothetical protein